MDIPSYEIVVRTLLALVTAAAIGLERELTAQPAGLRTHVLVGLGAALFTIAGTKFTGGDPSRVAAQVASGIGFLGAGAILQERFRVRGLTTAASLWVTAALGVAAGIGAYTGLAAVTVASLIVLAVLKWIEREYFPRQRGQTLAVHLAAGVGLTAALDSVQRIAGPFDLRQIEPTGDGGQRLAGHVRLRRTPDILDVAERLEALPGVTGVSLLR